MIFMTFEKDYTKHIHKTWFFSRSGVLKIHRHTRRHISHHSAYFQMLASGTTYFHLWQLRGTNFLFWSCTTHSCSVIIPSYWNIYILRIDESRVIDSKTAYISFSCALSDNQKYENSYSVHNNNWN